MYNSGGALAPIMTWKGLGIGTASDGNDSAKRSSAIYSESPLRHSEHVPRPTPSEGQPNPPRLSESVARSHGGGTSNGASSSSPEGPPISQRKQNRFSLMKFRHASDPQLSKTYTESKPPPVPPVPPRKLKSTLNPPERLC